jgi:hypothetical protein
LDPLIKSWLDVVSAHPDRYWSSPHNVADPARRRVPDKVLAATGMWMAADLAVVAEPPALSARRFAAASKRTRQAIRRSRCAPQYESIASRGVGGTNGRPSARDRTADGKMRGNALVRRASDRRLLSAFSSSHLDIVAPRIDGMMASCREGFVTSGMPPPGRPAEELEGEDHAGERGGASFRARI